MRPFIDAHMHANFFGDNPELFFQGISPAELIAERRKIGMEKAIILDPAPGVFEMQKLLGDLVVPIPMVNPDSATPQELDEYFKLGAPGIKFIAPGESYGSERYWPLYDVVLQNRGLAVFHTGFLITGVYHPGGRMPREKEISIEDMRPATLDRVARAFPELKIMMAHFGNPWWEEAWKIMYSHPNIYADLSGGTALRRDLGMWAQIFAPNGRLDVNAVSKLCFASDLGILSYEKVCEDYFSFYGNLFDKIQVPEEILEKIYRTNILELIKR